LTSIGSDLSIINSLSQEGMIVGGKSDKNYEWNDKMCYLTSSRDQIDSELLKELTKDSRYICRACGRSAIEAERLCAPETMLKKRPSLQ
jgi:hypothetical protein